jgi:enamine deaminase RidA (YjgF/YER057c/UK114 family)
MSRKSFTPSVLRSYYDEWHFSPALEIGEFVFLSGFSGVAPDGSLSDDPDTQFTQVFETIGLVLAQAGLDFRHIVDMTSYHVGLRSHLDIFRRVKDRYVLQPYPAWTAIGVAELAVEEALVEVKVTASKTDPKR